MEEPQPNMQEKISRGGKDAGAYFAAMANFVGFDKQQSDAIYESRYVIEKHIPGIVAQFYNHLLRYPPTRQFFLKQDGSLNQEYVSLRMQHLANFWRNTAYGPYNDEYARYIDYVGRAHTRRGADPRIDIPERYVIGQVGFVQHAISEALSRELHSVDPEWEIRALKAWNLLMMVLLEMLARAYSDEDDPAAFAPAEAIDSQMVHDMAVDSYERGVGIHRLLEIDQVIFVGNEADIPLGERKIVKALGHSVGVFHHTSGWYAVKNKCLHAGGPVAEGRLRDDILICPWHGYQYDLPSGAMLSDPSARLTMYPVELFDGQVFVRLPVVASAATSAAQVEEAPPAPVQAAQPLKKNEFRLSELKAGEIGLVELDGESIAVFNLDGNYYALEDFCSHAGGPLSEGSLQGQAVVCPWHGSCFDVTNGALLCGPATLGVKAFKVEVEGNLGRVLPAA